MCLLGVDYGGSRSGREAIIGRVELGLSYAELAAAMGRPSADAARMAVGRALLKLAKRLEVP
jgi:DNA-directed RNA polymerase specialized sigma24 family protein